MPPASPRRSPLPPAHTIATTRAAAHACASSAASAGKRRAREDHASGRRLQHRRDLDVGLGADELAAGLDDDHRAVIEIADALIGFLARLGDLEPDDLAREVVGPKRGGRLVEVEDVDSAHAGDLGEVVVDGDERAAGVDGEPHELLVDVRGVGVVGLEHRHGVLGGKRREQVETAAAARATRVVGRVGERLQLGEHEARHAKRARQEAETAQLDEAPVDDGARVEQHDALVGGHELGRRETRKHRREVAALGQRGAHEQVRDDEHEQHGRRGGEPRRLEETERPRCEKRDEQADDEAGGRQQQIGRRRVDDAGLGALPECRELSADDAAEDVPDRSPENDQEKDDVVAGKTEFCLPVDETCRRVPSHETARHQHRRG